jgi:hypothetical protein
MPSTVCIMVPRTLVIFALSALGVVDFSTPGHAEGPAVSGLNGKVSIEGGTTGSEGGQSAIGIAQGSISAPLGQSLGLQIDGGAATAGAFYGGGAVHAFWRDPAVGLVGPLVAMTGGSGSRTGFYMGEAEYYVGILTIGMLAGYQDGISHGSTNASSGGYFAPRLTVYPMADLALSIQGSSAAGQREARGGLEYQPESASLHNMALFINGSIGDNAAYRVTVGFRFYFGPDKTLIRRHREDDPGSFFDFHPNIIINPNPPPPYNPYQITDPGFTGGLFIRG